VSKKRVESASATVPPDPRVVEPSLSLEPVRALGDGELPRVAIVILNWNGRHHLAGCFESLAGLEYPRERVEVILVDNGSKDGSQREIRSRHAGVRLIENPRNLGFSAGCNQGAREARDPEVLVFLNNDIRVEPAFLRELVAPIVRGRAVATSARMYSWDGKRMNSAGGGMNFHGIGIQRGYEVEPGPEYDVPRSTLFACGGAMAMDAEVFESIGGFDEEFFAYYEDVDLGWRTWVLGYAVEYTPGAVCYHHHSSTSRRVPIERLRLLQVRNPLLACVKNYSDANLRTLLAPALALAVRRAILHTGLYDTSAYRIESVEELGSGRGLSLLLERLTGKSGGRDKLRRVGIADLLAIDDLLGNWKHWLARRAEVQGRRRRSDEEIFRLFLRPLWCIEPEPQYKELHDGLVDFFGIGRLFEGLTTLHEDPRR
jgi:GT2 family glycosyltransferase